MSKFQTPPERRRQRGKRCPTGDFSCGGGFGLGEMGFEIGPGGIEIGFRTRRGDVLRNELGCARNGSKTKAFHLPMRRGFSFFLGPQSICMHGGAESLQFGERFIEAALGGGAVAESESEKRLVDVGVVESSQFEREGTIHAPLAEGHLIEEHALGFGGGPIRRLAWRGWR